MSRIGHTPSAPLYFQVFLPVMANLLLFRISSLQTKNPIMAGAQAQEHNQTSRPGISQPFVHLYGKQRESGCKRAPDKRVCHESARGVDRVRLGGEGEDARECQQRSRANYGWMWIADGTKMLPAMAGVGGGGRNPGSEMSECDCTRRT